MRFYLLIFFAFVSLTNAFTATLTWVGTTSSSWNVATNWSPAQVPVSTDNIIINSAVNNPGLIAATTVNSFTINSGTLSQNTFSLTINGAGSFVGGIITGGSITISSLSATFSGTTFNSDISASCAAIYFNGSSFDGTMNIFTQTGATNITSNGGNTFNNLCEIILIGTGNMTLGSMTGDIFAGQVTFKNNSSSSVISVADGSTGNVFSGQITLDNGTSQPAGTRKIQVCRNVTANLLVSNLVRCNNNGSDGIYFGQNGGASTFDGSSFLSSDGFVGGTMHFANVHFLSNIDVLSGAFFNDASLILGPGNDFDDGLTASATRIFLNGGVYDGWTIITKTGSGDDQSEGGNVFNAGGMFEIENNGTGNMILGAVNPDKFYCNGIIRNTTTDKEFRIAENSVGNEITATLTLDNGVNFGSGTRSIHVSKQGSATLSISGTINLNNNNSKGIYFGENGGFTTFENTSGIGSLGFVGGTLLMSNTLFNITANLNSMFTNGASLILGPGIDVQNGINASAPRIFLNGGAYNGFANIIKTGAGDDLSLGGNNFNAGMFEIENNGTGNMVLGVLSPDKFYCNGTIKNTTTDKELRIAESSAGNEIAATVTFDNGTAFIAGTRSIHVTKQAGATLSVSGTVNLNNNNSNGIYFGQNGGTTTFENFSGVGSLGFVGGTLLLSNVHAIENLNFSSMFSNGASLILGPFNDFDNGIYAVAPRLFLNGGVYDGVTNLMKSGAGDDLSQGGNTFNTGGMILLENNGTGNMVLGTINPDKFHCLGTIKNTTTDKEIRIAESSAGNEITSDLTLDNGVGFGPGTRTIHVANQNGSYLSVSGNINLNNNNSAGIYFGINGGETTFENFSSISSLGFAGGTCQFANVHSVGYFNLPNSMFSNGASLILGPDNFFESGINAQAPRLFLNGGLYYGNTQLLKSGANDDVSLGGNIFMNGNFLIANNGSGNLVMGSTNPDKFNCNGIISNISTDNEFRIAESSVGNEMTGSVNLYNGPGGSNKAIHITKESGSTLDISGMINLQNNNTKGIFFGENGGTTTFASGFSFGSTSFDGGVLLLKNIHSIDWMNLGALLFTGDAAIKIGPQSLIDGGITAAAPRIFLNGGDFKGLCQLQKTGGGDDLSDGGNIFNAGNNFHINNFGTGDLVLGNINPDKFNGACMFFNATSDKQIRIAEASVGNEINGPFTMTNGGFGTNSFHIAKQSTATVSINSEVSCTNNGLGGIYFGEGGGISTFNSGSYLSSSGFSDGTLLLSNIVTYDPFGVAFMSNVASLKLGPSNTFNNTVNVYVPRLFLNGGTYQMSAILQKFGSSNDDSYGGNNFNASVTLRNEGDGNFNMANNSSDYFNQAVNVINSGTGNLDLAFTAESFVRGNLSFNLSSPAASGTNGGYVTFGNGNAQSISSSGIVIPVFNYLRMNKSANSLTLNCPVKIGVLADFLSGKIMTTSTNYLEFLDNSNTTNNESDLSFVSGPVIKTGNDFFAFPVGKGNDYRPCAIDAPSQITDVFTAEYIPSNSNVNYPHTSAVPSLAVISTCDYWTIDRTNGNSSVNVWLSWKTPGCNGITDMNDLTIARWDSGLSQWQDHGNGGTFGDVNNGYMTSAIAPTNFSPFALASITTENPLPVELLDFSVTLVDNRNVDINWTTASEHNSSHFELEGSENGYDFNNLANIEAAGFSSELINYKYQDVLNGLQQKYYRLKQVDKDGQFEYSPIRSVTIGEEQEVLIYPNPIRSGSKLSIIASEEINKVIITDVLGNEILKADYSNIQEIDLPAGSYQLRFWKDDLFRSTQHLIVVE